MAQKIENWIDFWDKKADPIEGDMKKHMEIFSENIRKILDFDENDTILDIGCGLGHLEEFLKDKAKEIWGIDTSKRYIRLCKEKFKKNKNLNFLVLDRNNYTDLSFLGKQKFSKIICVSVVQYYKNAEEIEKLIMEVKKISLPNSKFLIADIPVEKGSLHDALGFLKTAFKKRYVFQKMKYFYGAYKSGYYKLRASKNILTIPIQKLNDIIVKYKLNAKIIDINLTINENRKHLLINF